MNNDVIKRLETLKIEDLIWILYIGIIAASLYSNVLERKYFKCKDMEAKEDYQKINVAIFLILVIVYTYFLKSAFDDFIAIKDTDTKKHKQLATFSFIASLLIFISGIIFLYIAIADNDIDVEVAFN